MLSMPWSLPGRMQRPVPPGYRYVRYPTARRHLKIVKDRRDATAGTAAVAMAIVFGWRANVTKTVSHARPREGFSNQKLFQWEKALQLIIN
jgi:hypothetical protein